MKSKFTKKPDMELEKDDEESAEVESSGPAIAAAKKSKMMIIAASSLLITVVVYFLFFKSDDKKSEKLEEVSPPMVRVAPSEKGQSPFEIDVPEKSKEEVTLLAKPATPDAPTLPELPEGAVSPDQLPDIQNQEQEGQTPPLLKQLLPTQQIPNQPVEQQPKQEQMPAQNEQVQSEEKKPEKIKELNPRYAPIIVFSGAAEGAPARGVGYENNIVQLNWDAISKLPKSQAGVVASYISDRLHTIAQGKLFTAVLETAIHTEIPGSVRAVISRDVYGEAGNEVLIPRGSRLFGSYSSTITRGQGRVQISWTRLIRPDGVDLAIKFNASDQFGRSGIVGDTDNKYNALITSSLLTSILAVGGVAAVQSILGGSNSNTTSVTTNGTTSTTGSATNQAIYDVSKTITDTVGTIVKNAIDSTPVIRVPQGTRITVIVNSDINIPSISAK
jgi:type IV secretion system protein VirB10